MPQLCTNYFEISICKKDAYSNQFDLFRHKQILKFTYNWWFHTTDPRRNEVYRLESKVRKQRKPCSKRWDKLQRSASSICMQWLLERIYSLNKIQNISNYLSYLEKIFFTMKLFENSQIVIFFHFKFSLLLRLSSTLRYLLT